MARAWCLHRVLLRLHRHLPKDRQKVWGLVRDVACVVMGINNVQIVFHKVVSQENPKVRVNLAGSKESLVDGTKGKGKGHQGRHILLI